MCTETFRRLPEEKRNRILNAAWEEFTTVPFAGASINQIIRRAGIPRGSFYQYFADKSDLFSCLMDDVREQMARIFRDILSETDGDIFQTALNVYEQFQERQDGYFYAATDRLLRVMNINPKIDMESVICVKPDEFITETYLDRINISQFRQKDAASVLRICRLISLCMASAIADLLHNPGQKSDNKQELIEMLKIIRRGCIRREILLQENAIISMEGGCEI